MNFVCVNPKNALRKERESESVAAAMASFVRVALASKETTDV